MQSLFFGLLVFVDVLLNLSIYDDGHVDVVPAPLDSDPDSSSFMDTSPQSSEIITTATASFVKSSEKKTPTDQRRRHRRYFSDHCTHTELERDNLGTRRAS
jgi:hypothetical protein